MGAIVRGGRGREILPGLPSTQKVWDDSFVRE